jgi:hypothetical protein
MKRKVVRSESEVVKLTTKLLRKQGSAVEEIEQTLGVEFPFKDGTYHSEMDQQPEDKVVEWESQDVDFDKYRKVKEGFFPKTYPAVMLWCVENDFDRFGPVNFRMFEFVELTDFR